jgi:hypothetical protein
MQTLKSLRKFVTAPILVIALLMFAIACTAAVMQQTPPPASPPYEAPKNEPRIITPGRTNADAPSDAIILFNGKDLSAWQTVKDGSAAQWDIVDGAMQVKPGTGDIRTKQGFGDCQLHIEWATPSVVKGEGQGRGNSGVFLMERYEIQVLDSYNNKTYFHGQAGAFYKQYAPLVNASRPPGEWQTYDIIFKAPKFDEMGKVTQRARMTAFHNGVLIQNDIEIHGIAWNDRAPVYLVHSDKEPIQLQDHGDLVRFRNIWIRPL